MNMEVSEELKVKEEPICYTQSIIEKKLKEEPIDSENSLIESMTEEVKVKDEEKFSATEEFSNKTSIAFLNEETTQETTTNTNQEA